MERFMQLFVLIFALTGTCAVGQIICSSPAEVYTSCGKPLNCQEHCQTTASDIIACPSVCSEVCSCAKDYIRNIVGGSCILETECPSEIGLDYIYTQ